MMGRQRRDQGKLFYKFHLDDRMPKDHLLRRIDVFVTAALADLHKELEPHYSDIGRPSIDPELMIRMLIVGYCCGIRSERRLTQEVELPWHIAGFVSSTWKTRSRITRPSPPTGLAASERAIASQRPRHGCGRTRNGRNARELRAFFWGVAQ
jgi:hypothetical protein